MNCSGQFISRSETYNTTNLLTFAPGPDLFIDNIIWLGHIECRLDADRWVIQMSRPHLGHMRGTIDLLVFRVVLVVEIRLQSKLCAAHDAFETPVVVEREVFERPNPVHLVHGLATAQADGLIQVWRAIELGESSRGVAAMRGIQIGHCEAAGRSPQQVREAQISRRFSVTREVVKGNTLRCSGTVISYCYVYDFEW